MNHQDRKKLRSKQNSKRANQIHHAIGRAEERYGLKLTPDDLADMVGRIRHNEGIMVRRTSLRVSVYDVETHSQTVRIVYDSLRRSIVTFLNRNDEGRENQIEQT